jgi:hypothetical protein
MRSFDEIVEGLAASLPLNKWEFNGAFFANPITSRG